MVVYDALKPAAQLTNGAISDVAGLSDISQGSVVGSLVIVLLQIFS